MLNLLIEIIALNLCWQGFHNSEMNRTLLVKNEGSVKRVVLDLLSAEKDASSMQPTLSKKAKQS
jgi:hypothetical protein